MAVGLPLLLASRLFLALAGVPAELRLRLLPESLAEQRGAQCLDHSPAGYYVREQDSQKWVIFLEGGGLCVTAFDCLKRRFSHWGSSKYLDPDEPPEGLGPASLSDLNPFANFSQVWIPYCSGDTWLGKSPKPHPMLFGMQMSGHLILETIVDELLATTSLGKATDVIFSGSSAGGIGTFHHADWLSDRLAARARAKHQAPPRIAAFPIEGFFFPMGFPVLLDEFAWGSKEPLYYPMSKYLHLLQWPWLHPACIQAAHEEDFPVADCFNVAKMVWYTKTPMFIGMNRFDKLLIQDLGLCLKCKGPEEPSSLHGRYIRFYGALTNKTVIHVRKKLPRTGFFIPSAFHHDENFYSFFDTEEKSIGGMTLRAAFEAWYWKRRPMMLVEDTCNEDGPCIPEHGTAPPSVQFV